MTKRATNRAMLLDDHLTKWKGKGFAIKILEEMLLRQSNVVNNSMKWPWLDQKPLSMENANKFFLGAIIDYQVNANKAWDSAERFAEAISSNAAPLWHSVANFSAEEWAAKKKAFGLHWMARAHSRVHRIGTELVNKYSGDTRQIWKGRSVNEVTVALEALQCGEQISRMIIGALITTGHLRGSGDVKADRHVKRVLGSILMWDYGRGMDEESAVTFARMIHPANPWALDAALYDTGKRFCKDNELQCLDCPVDAQCWMGEEWRQCAADVWWDNYPDHFKKIYKEGITAKDLLKALVSRYPSLVEQVKIMVRKRLEEGDYTPRKELI